MSSNMIRRIAFAVVAIPLLIGVVWLGEWPLAAVLIAATTLGVGEFFGLAERAGERPFAGLGRLFAVAVPVVLMAMATVPAARWLVGNWTYLLLLGLLVVVGTA